MTRLLIALALILSLHTYAQDWRYVKNKKVYRDLNEAIANPTDVYNLELSGREVKEEKLHLIAGMKNIRFLALDNAGLDSLPDAIFSLCEIRTLSLTNNNFKAIPRKIVRLKKLEYLVMYDNQLTAVPDFISELTNLQTLILPRNKITYISPRITHLQKLMCLNLGENTIRGLPRNIGSLQALQELDLHQNALQALPESICRLKKLQALHLNGNKLTAVPDNIGLLQALQNLQLGANVLNTIPVSVNELKHLTALGLENNPLPALTGDMQLPANLEHLELAGNNLKTFPACLRQCKRLTHLAITKTAITTVPDWIGELNDLDWLVLDDNKITALPASMANLLSLSVIWIARNQLDTIPGKLFLLPELRVLNINNNPVKHIPLQVLQAPAMTQFCIMGTGVSNKEYRAVRKKAPAKLDIPHDKLEYFEDDDKLCYRDMLDMPLQNVFTRFLFEPYFVGHAIAWQTFVDTNCRKDQLLNALSAKPANWHDSVVLKFIVRKEGGLSNINAVYFNDTLMAGEAVRLLKLSCPWWAPALIDARSVTAWFAQSFIFTLSNKDGKRELSIRVVTPHPAPARKIDWEKN